MERKGDIRVVYDTSADLPSDLPGFLADKSEKTKDIYRVIRELMGSQKISEMMSDFYTLAEVPMAIIDLDANVLASSKWEPICTDFHRADAETCKRCIESDTELANSLEEGDEFTMYRCKNGLVDCASPIIVEGEHVANVFIGQFMLEAPDRDFFIAQAAEFGFDREAYLNALDEVTIIDADKAKSITSFMQKFSQMVATMSIDRYKSIAFEKSQRRHLEALVTKKTEEIREKEELMFHQARLVAMGEMVSMIAHQWRQPISAVAMEANNLLADIALGQLSESAVRENANMILAQTQHLSKTIDDFKNFFSPQKEQRVCSVDDVVADTLEVVEKSLQYHNVTIIREAHAMTGSSLYANELMHVVINLLNNAKDAFVERAVSGDRTIWLTTYEGDGKAYIVVQDNAGGIDNAIMKKVFEPYFSTKQSRNGTGLGLYMAKTIIEQHFNGSIGARNVEGGLKMTIAVPVVSQG
jgi:signal transduction histidine kinase